MAPHPQDALAALPAGRAHLLRAFERDLAVLLADDAPSGLGALLARYAAVRAAAALAAVRAVAGRDDADAWALEALRGCPQSGDVLAAALDTLEAAGRTEGGAVLDAAALAAPDEAAVLRAVRWYERVGDLPRLRALLAARVRGRPLAGCWRVAAAGLGAELRAGSFLLGVSGHALLLRAVCRRGAASALAPLHHAAALAHYRLADYAAAEAVCARGLALCPRHIHLVLLLLRAAAHRPRRQDAVAAVVAAAARHAPGLGADVRWRAHAECAAACARLGAPAAAEAALRAAQAAAPPPAAWKPLLHAARVWAGRDAARAEAALDACAKAAGARGAALVAVERARLAELRGDADAAAEAARVAAGADDWKLALEAATVLVRLGRAGAALEASAEATRRFPATGRVWGLHVQLARAAGPAAQHAALAAALRGAPKSGEVWCEAARLAAADGDLYHARLFLGYAQAFTPQYGDLYVERIRLCIRARDMAGLRDTVAACLHADPTYGLLWGLWRSEGPAPSPLPALRAAFHALRRAMRAGTDPTPLETYLAAPRLPSHIRTRLVLNAELLKA